MTLHIFNPEHDIALASGLANFTAPHAARQLRHDLGALPVLWADEGDAVLADDAGQAQGRSMRWPAARRAIVTREQLSRLGVDRIEPWGWNAALRAFLLRYGVDERLLPSPEWLAAVRQLSHRRQAAWLLSELRREDLKCGTVGRMFECRGMAEVEQLLDCYGRLVLKAPWSSSGRGIRFVVGEKGSIPPRSTLGMERGWLRNVLARQGVVMAEPYYPKVKDFGMEFRADSGGRVSYEGLSLFHTENGAYKGNVVATERAKTSVLSRYIPETALHAVQMRICSLLSEALQGKYSGPLGVDMMVVANGNDGFLLHPAVEINLRRTMGHVALALGRRLNPTNDDEVCHVMRIDYTEQNYKLKIYRQ